jgi:hypothetical protein
MGLNGLRAWALSLPFVRERMGQEDGTRYREFVIRCPLLALDRPWLLIRDAEPERMVIALFTHDDGEMSCIGFTTGGTAYDAPQIEAALLFAYESAFVDCSR